MTDERPTPTQRLRLLVLRADVAGRLGDKETAAAVLDDAAAIPLSCEERASVRDNLERLDELRD